MTKVYDFSEFEVEDHIYSFAEMSLVEIAQKRKELEAYEVQKAAAKESKTGDQASAKPAMKPKPVTKPDEEKKTSEKGEAEKPKPKFRPKPMIKRKPKDDGDK